MTTAVPPEPGRERAVTYLASELDQRLRTWAALLGLKTSHLLATVIAEATPSRDQLAEMVHRAGNGSPSGRRPSAGGTREAEADAATAEGRPR